MITITSAASWFTFATIAVAATIPSTQSTNPKAVYVLTNDAQNAVLAMKVNGDGTLSEGTTTSTGGQGIAKYPAESYSSHTYQGSLGVIGNTLIAVNTGSNTFSVFSIDEKDPTKLALVGDQINSRGAYPQLTLNQSSLYRQHRRHRKHPVLNAQREVKYLSDNNRPFNHHVATPPQTGDRTLSEILFNADSSALIASFKGETAGSKTPGKFAVFPVSADGNIATKAIESTPQDTSILCGFAAIPGTNNLLVTDPSQNISGAAIVKLDSDTNQFSIVKAIAIETNNAITHAAFSSSSNSVFVADELVNHLTELDPKTGAILNDIPLMDHKGFVDLSSVGGFVYALEAADAGSIAVLDVKSKKEVQKFQGKGLGKNVLGLVGYEGIMVHIDG
ncbi:MAG: hypothetical protein M1812_003677 [Candelaria pacifica]|nr:MAG: hypothetical protein M1812_003677 [Candelaria pacifica]